MTSQFSGCFSDHDDKSLTPDEEAYNDKDVLSSGSSYKSNTVDITALNMGVPIEVTVDMPKYHELHWKGSW